jgi:hypothetical protein
VTLKAGGLIQQREVASARGYLSASELPITFGLGKATQIEEITIQWPDQQGSREVLKGLAIDRVHVIRQK